MTHYIIQTIAFQLLFLLSYDLFLKRETFFSYNRVYLLGTAVLSLVLPLIKISGFATVIPQEYIVRLPEVVIGQQPVETVQLDAVTLTAETASASGFAFSWSLLYFVGLSVALLFLLYKIMKVVRLARSHKKEKTNGIYIVNLPNSTLAFSFFNYMFLGENLSEEEKTTIVEHERVHIVQKHGLDLLFFELLRAVFWFNPLVYMYQNRLGQVHEFLADAGAVKAQEKTTYYQSLLAQVFDTKNISFINPFFKSSIIKKRIIMLQKSKSNRVKLAKYALLIPMVVGMLIYSSCSENPETAEEPMTVSDQIEALKQIVENEKLSEKDLEALREVLMKARKNSVEIIEVEELPEDNSQYDGLPGVPFAVIDEIPVYPGTPSGLSQQDQKAHFNKQIAQFIGQEFNTDLANELGLTGRQRISVTFKIDTDGNIVDIKSRAPFPALETEAKRVVSLLPQMQPGKQNGKAVNVPYALPIVFEVSE